MNRKQKGFSLLELLVSMLIVSVAMLGFAALQAYSSRALSSSYARTSETAVFQDFIKLFQVSNYSVSNLAWGGEQEIDFNCANAKTQLKYQGQAVSPVSVLANGVEDVCTRLARSPAIVSQAVRFRLTRNSTALSKLNSYQLTISFAYVPKKKGDRTDQNGNDVVVSLDNLDNYCPITGNVNDEILNKRRIEHGVVCNRIEVLL